jgi:hypothetical protein
MGTNYYLHRDTCSCCGRASDELHIGKSSYGWCFGLQVLPYENINNLEDWKKEWSKIGAVIKDEYGEIVSRDEMLDIIIDRRGSSTAWINPMENTYKNELDFLRKNHAEKGPKGLLRHRLDSHCIGHGEGTWDLITGDFS